MIRSARLWYASCHDARRIMSVFFALYCAVRFSDALRFSFYYGFFYPPKTICGNCVS